jgi:hypothetical protein
MNRQFENKLRLLKLDLLVILHTLAVTGSIAMELSEISDSTSTSEPELKGSISSIRRIKIGEENIIIPAGRDKDGRIRWQINEKVVNKKELAKFLEDEILGKNINTTTN